MKKVVSLSFALVILFSFSNLTFARKGGYVKGYYRKDGTYVSPHYRRGTSSTSKSTKTYKPKSSKSDSPYKYSENSYLTNSKIKVIDGDTFYYNGKKCRVSGIDTPEKGQYNYERAKNRLETLLKYGTVEIREVAKDKYGRSVVKVRVNGEDVSDILKREGLQKPK
ncbi:MAG: thermonuclease family protein [Elusimicrobiales bacterium]|nr:thermonuclease family protein [Elusimicrobiales bacterium]